MKVAYYWPAVTDEFGTGTNDFEGKGIRPRSGKGAEGRKDNEDEEARVSAKGKERGQASATRTAREEKGRATRFVGRINDSARPDRSFLQTARDQPQLFPATLNTRNCTRRKADVPHRGIGSAIVYKAERSSCAKTQYHENSSRSRSFHGIIDGDRERMQLFGTKITSQRSTSITTHHQCSVDRPTTRAGSISVSLLTMTTTTTIGTMCIASMLLTKLSSAKGNEKTKKERKKKAGRKRAQEKVRRFSRRALVYFCTPSHFKGGSLIR
ncbi:Uncharacterized protein DBV15_05654 [Temnothorax longispinosus]|uniref:Uncharacterized protein n=1 Tax=Temnothorax longispinosus TaxID=300112 RepID=A0A4S2JR99_9HYME|nr:Uncharacterized protein DBV15_05654 [Temnothorax longispinosus]